MNFNSIKRIPKKYLYMILAAVVAAAAVFLFLGMTRNSGRDGAGKGSVHTYGTYVESKLADDVSWYLSGVDAIDKDAREDIADYSVQNYNAVIRSGTAAVTDEHSEALTRVFQNKIGEYASGRLTENEVYALSSGISSYVWQAVLSTLNDYRAADMPPDRDTEYMELAESLQAQINALEEKRMNIHITARLNDVNGTSGNDDTYKTDIERYLSGGLESVNSSVDEKINGLDDDIDKKLDGMKSNISSELGKELNSSMTDDINKKMDGVKSDLASELEKELNGSMTDDINKKMDGVKSDLNSEIEKLKNSIKDGKDGTAGKDGKDGKNGEDGEDGKDGKDGQDGKSTYVAYANDTSGNGFSLTPTETSKYIGTCVTTADRQPSNASEYGNWQLYRSYVITSTTDENGSTTLYIR